MRFCTVTLGCKANRFDADTIEKILQSRSHVPVKPGDGCDVYIINTCAVTSESVRKSRQAIRRARKLEPHALIAVCGCFPQLEHGAAAALGADIIGGTNEAEAFADRIESKTGKSQKSDNSARNIRSSRTRALLKIQDGCGNRCAYCIIPQVRGASRSAAPDEIADMARALETQGYKEIVVTGIEISSYVPSLTSALQIISGNAPGARLRLGSLNPDILTAQFIKQLSTIPKLCCHFHISLQSGCDETLRRMNRKYETAQVLQAAGMLRDTFENCAVTADLITGFPGETEREFEQTMAFIDAAAFSAMHIFPFSKRPGTAAAAMPGHIDSSIKRQRAKLAARKAGQLSTQYRLSQIGRELEVLFERSTGGCSTGHSENYQLVSVPHDSRRGFGKIDRNTIKTVKILSMKDNALFGEIV